jgi:hypothetical protein
MFAFVCIFIKKKQKSNSPFSSDVCLLCLPLAPSSEEHRDTRNDSHAQTQKKHDRSHSRTKLRRIFAGSHQLPHTEACKTLERGTQFSLDTPLEIAAKSGSEDARDREGREREGERKTKKYRRGDD